MYYNKINRKRMRELFCIKKYKTEQKVMENMNINNNFSK